MPVLEHILSALAPHECLVCAHEGSLLCDTCAFEVLEPIPERCYRCLAKSRDNAVCQKCRRYSSLKYVWVATEYEGVAKELLRRFKFEFAQAAHKPVAHQLLGTLPYLKPGAVITYLPTATSRYRMRGYDQSELVAKRLAKLKKVEFMPLLARHGQTRQVGSSKKQRIAQADGMFWIKGLVPQDVEIIIVDDILTTGASLQAAAKLLKQAGAKQVSAAVFAQKH